MTQALSGFKGVNSASVNHRSSPWRNLLQIGKDRCLRTRSLWSTGCGLSGFSQPLELRTARDVQDLWRLWHRSRNNRSLLLRQVGDPGAQRLVAPSVAQALPGFGGSWALAAVFPAPHGGATPAGSDRAGAITVSQVLLKVPGPVDWDAVLAEVPSTAPRRGTHCLN
jgi:hypothetical protein